LESRTSHEVRAAVGVVVKLGWISEAALWLGSGTVVVVTTWGTGRLALWLPPISDVMITVTTATATTATTTSRQRCERFGLDGTNGLPDDSGGRSRTIRQSSDRFKAGLTGHVDTA
jgi:hypothetical protein